MPVDLVRDAAIDVLLRVFERGVHLDVSLDKTLRRKALGERGRRFMTQLVYGTVRHRLLCDHVLRPLCRQPLEEFPPAILAILRMAVFQGLFCHQVTRPAMVHTSVDLAKRRGHAGLGRLTNAVLRRVPASLEEVSLPSREQHPVRYLSVRYSIPEWIVEDWSGEFGRETAEALCQASGEQAPVSVRANLLKTTRAELAERLGKAGFEARPKTAVPEELTLTGTPSPVHTHWFQEGHFLQQDPSSMLPPHLLAPQAGECLLDMCASPGGKTTHLAELTGCRARIVAADANPRRFVPLQQNIARLGLSGIGLVCCDGARPALRGGFDGVLVDAPCSGLGTLRRHPDLKWRMTREAVGRLAEQQRMLLRSAVGLCKNGGRIVYSVCTLTRQETFDVIQDILLEGHVETEDGPEWFERWRLEHGKYWVLPSGEALDGFFLTRLRKRS